MTGRELSSSLRGGRRAYGTLIVSTSPHWPAAAKATGLDFAFIDTEHIAIDRTTLAWMCQTFRALAVAPVVRIPSPDPYQACVALDNGAEGVIAPYVETPDQARELSGAVKHRPLKGGYLRDILEGRVRMGVDLESYVRERNAGNVLIVNIESTPALEALDEILAVPGLDAVQVGPHDLTSSLGVPEQYDHPLYLDAVRTIITKARARGVGAGVHFWLSVEREIEWARLGANLIVHSGDIMLFTQKLRDNFDRMRTELGDTSSKPAVPETAV